MRVFKHVQTESTPQDTCVHKVPRGSPETYTWQREHRGLAAVQPTCLHRVGPVTERFRWPRATNTPPGSRSPERERKRGTERERDREREREKERTEARTEGKKRKREKDRERKGSQRACMCLCACMMTGMYACIHLYACVPMHDLSIHFQFMAKSRFTRARHPDMHPEEDCNLAELSVEPVERFGNVVGRQLTPNYGLSPGHDLSLIHI